MFILWFILLCICPSLIQTSTNEDIFCHPFIILICPTGDIVQRGRTIFGSTEAALTLSFATALHTELISRQSCYPIISRAAGQQCEPLHTAQYANKLQANVCIILSLFESYTPEPTMYLYHSTSSSKPKNTLNNFTFYPYHQAYLFSSADSATYSKKLYTKLRNSNITGHYTIHPPREIRHSAMIGILAPTIVIEIGIPTDHAWKNMVTPIADAMQTIIEKT